MRIYHRWEKWECYKAGFYNTAAPCGITPDDARVMYRDFLSDNERFHFAISRVLEEWPNSCDQFLSNENINRIAWLGQASMCIETGVPSCFRGGFKLLTNNHQIIANKTADHYLTKWLRGKIDKSNQKEGSGVCGALEAMRLF